ncbi:MAG: T9SS type A sorting domain-containing protein [Bacteroidia bacterium]
MDPGIAIAPNPASDRLRIGWSADLPQADIQLLDLQGKTVLSVNNATPGHELDLTSLSKGVYLLQLSDAGKRWSRKLVVN